MLPSCRRFRTWRDGIPWSPFEAIVDVESWARMREQFGLSVDEACAVRVQAVDRLLPPTP